MKLVLIVAGIAGVAIGILGLLMGGNPYLFGAATAAGAVNVGIGAYLA